MMGTLTLDDLYLIWAALMLAKGNIPDKDAEKTIQNLMDRVNIMALELKNREQ
jgi:hypothetical protein